VQVSGGFDSRDMAIDHDRISLGRCAPPAPLCQTAFALVGSDLQSVLILRADLRSQMLAQRFNAVGTEIIVEIPETRF
jgi:hypothetical protein